MFVLALLLAASAIAATGEIDARVTDPRGAAVAGAQVTIGGETARARQTDARGRAGFTALPPGRYDVTVRAAGFTGTRRDDVIVAPGATASVELTLAPETLSSLSVIGRQLSAPGGSGAPGGPAAAAVVNAEDVIAADPINVAAALDRIPGVTSTTNASVGANRASFGIPQVTQIRGALPYETQSLIDGHPVSVGADGTFSPLLVKPAFLQSIEVAKGPGATTIEQSAAIGGTVNYRLLEPTQAPHAALWAGLDRYGGTDEALRATGSAGRLGYAAAFTVDGTPGPLAGTPVLTSGLPLLYSSPPYYIGGMPIASAPIALAPNPAAPQFAGSIGLTRVAEPLAVCCAPLSTAYSSRGTMAKLRWSFDARSSLTATFLNASDEQDLSGARASDLVPLVDESIFAPPAGYHGSLAPGTPIAFDNIAGSGLAQIDRQQLAEADLRTAIGGTTLLARIYQSLGNQFLFNVSGSAPFSYGGQTWGGIATCPAGSTVARGTCVLPGGGTAPPAVTFYDGQDETFTASGPGSTALTTDVVNGISVQADRTIGASLLTLAVDRSLHESTQYVDSPSIPIQAYTLAPGSSQLTATWLARLELPFANDRGALTLANYVIAYRSHYSGDGGFTFATSAHTIDAPRAGLYWRTSERTALRFGMGASVAPPYINLLSSRGSLPVANTGGNPTAYLQNANDGTLLPETAFGYDLGVDRRMSRSASLHADAYLTTLHDLFLTTTTQNGVYTPSSGPSAGLTEPLFVTKAANLGYARFAGIELALNDDPPSGIGFVVQGSLERAYPYALAPGFYATSAGPYTTNLAIIPNVNFQPSGPGYNGLSGRIPYAQGYAALRWRSARGLTATLGATYYGPNNPYNEPAFAVLSAAVRVPLDPRTALELAADNLTSAYATPYESAYGGVPVPLVNGQLGATDGGNVGPFFWRLTLRRTLW